MLANDGSVQSKYNAVQVQETTKGRLEWCQATGMIEMVTTDISDVPQKEMVTTEKNKKTENEAKSNHDVKRES